MTLALGRYARAAAKAAAEPELLAAESVPTENLEEGVLADTRYTFADGTRLRLRIEQDEGNFDFSPEASACLPHEISYVVEQHPPHGCIEPARKTFANECRYLFWLKAQASNRAP